MRGLGKGGGIVPRAETTSMPAILLRKVQRVPSQLPDSVLEGLSMNILSSSSLPCVVERLVRACSASLPGPGRRRHVEEQAISTPPRDPTPISCCARAWPGHDTSSPYTDLLTSVPLPLPHLHAFNGIPPSPIPLSLPQSRAKVKTMQ